MGKILDVKGYEGLYTIDVDEKIVYRCARETKGRKGDKIYSAIQPTKPLVTYDTGLVRLVDREGNSKLISVEKILVEADPTYKPLQEVYHCIELNTYYKNVIDLCNHIHITTTLFYDNMKAASKEGKSTWKARGLNFEKVEINIRDDEMVYDKPYFESESSRETSGPAKAVRCVETSQVWPSIKECSKDIDCNANYLGQLIAQNKPYNDKHYKFL